MNVNERIITVFRVIQDLPSVIQGFKPRLILRSLTDVL